MQTVANTLAGHRSIRQFKPDEVPQTTIDEVLQEAIAGTSSSGNLNSYSLIVTRDPARKQRLYELHGEQEFVLQAPLVITFCADWYRTRQWLKLRGARDNFNNFLGYQVAANEAMLISQSVTLGFEARGYGICYMGTTLQAMGQIADYLGLPETCLPITTIAVGVPDEQPERRERLPMRAYVHDEVYQKPSAAELDDLYRAREESGWQRYMSMPRLKAMCEEGGITSLAQMYTSPYKYDPEAYAATSQQVLETLRGRGFLPNRLAPEQTQE
ncbi:nitroreductase family protein [Deinococcus humi]|uniref:Nitroreductase n=1 Tax=Deinococcus humi TaxID=662880 RepID=A0A7W8JXF4_9DEIO|nr:nitroreductase family protein [Deinococcus humi]MBB5365007.1 nitroreductase [Deinococcus humi]GGO34861.1 NADPH-dependent oxidoreductase [Deinococcus humi]